MKNYQELNIVEIDNEYLGDLIKIDVDKPNEVGVDRLINSYAGLNIYNGPLIIIDFGTATTFDVITNNIYLGGIIAPGVNLSLENLILFINATAKLSPNNKVILVLEVGTIPVGSASFTLGIKIFISLAFIKVLSGFDATPIILILNRLAYFKILVSSEVFPE